MATERQRRLYEAIEKKPYPSNEPLAGRREASDLGGKLGVENYSYHSAPSRHNLKRDPREQQKARRRRIYENEYKRPYPSRKRIQMLCRPAPTESMTYSSTTCLSSSSSNIGSGKKPRAVVVSPESTTRSPSEVPNQGDWMCNPAVCEGALSPDDEDDPEVYPQNLWKVATCGDLEEIEEPGEIALNESPMQEIRILTPQRRNSAAGAIEIEPEDYAPFCSFSSSSSSSDSKKSKDTPRHPIVKEEEVVKVVSPSVGPSKNCMTALVPSSDSVVQMAGCPPIPPIIQKSILRKPPIEEASGLPKEHHQHESYRTLHQYLKTTEEEELKLYIDDYQEAVFDRIVESFYGNTSLKTLTISRTRGARRRGSYRTTEEMICLFEATRCLPRLETLIFYNAQVHILPMLVENLPSSLEKIYLQVSDGSISDDMLDALAGKTNLKNIQLETQESMDLGRLVHSPSIETIRICGMLYDLEEHHMQGLAEALYSNRESILKFLDIQPMMNLSSWKCIAIALRFNASINTLKVSFTGENMTERDAATAELAELLHANTTLTHISNYTHETVVVSREISNELILEALHGNVTVQELRFFQEESVFWVAKQALVKRNQDYFGEEGDLAYAFFQQYVSFASALPAMKAKMCGDC